MRILLVTSMFLSAGFVCEQAFGQLNAEISTFPVVKSKPAPVGIRYHEFAFIKCDGNLIALHVMPDPRFGSAGVNYRWYYLTDGSDVFFSPSGGSGRKVGQLGRPPNKHVEVGAGSTDEGGSGMGTIKAGPLTMGWSMRTEDSGWLYFSNSDATVLIYSAQFKRLQDFSGSLDSGEWQPVNAAQHSKGSDSPLR